MLFSPYTFGGQRFWFQRATQAADVGERVETHPLQGRQRGRGDQEEGKNRLFLVFEGKFTISKYLAFS